APEGPPQEEIRPVGDPDYRPGIDRDLRRRGSASCCGVSRRPGYHARSETTDPTDNLSARENTMRLGIVTYMWGTEWDLPTLIKNCAETGFEGVELRTTHKHGVEVTLSPDQRKEVRRRFDDSPVRFVGPGSACEFHSPDPAVVRKNIEETKKFVVLSHDIGG